MSSYRLPIQQTCAILSLMLTKQRLIFILGFLLIVTLIWLWTTNHSAIWPIRNTVQYHVYTWWWDISGRTDVETTGTLEGAVTDEADQPIVGAWILVAEWDGATLTARSGERGLYAIDNIPTGTFTPVATAPGYESVPFGGTLGRVTVGENTTTIANVTLPLKPPHTITPGTDFSLGGPETVSCQNPISARAVQQQIHFKSNNEPNQLSFYYTPITPTVQSDLPVLLAIYPGPADGWVCASLALADAGYAVLAIGPIYTFDIESHLDEIEQLLAFAREGRFPGSDGRRIGLLGGSYSSLHVQRLLQRGQEVDAVLLLGPITDLFDMRRRLENGTYIPPFGLDRALIALGFPGENPLAYLRYSGAYHVRGDYPPLAILHSRSDDVVPYQQSQLLADNLALVGADYELHFFEAGGHYLLAEKADADTFAIYEVSLDFLEKYLIK